MILRFGFRNFLSFEEGVECSFESDYEGISKVNTLLSIRGANGAGKTNLLKALAFFMDFVANSFNLKPDAPTGVIPFFNSQKPTDFFVEFKTEDVESPVFLYELSLTKEKVVSERITRTIHRSTTIIERHENSIETIADFSELKRIKIRSNASLISCAHQNEIKALNSIYYIFYMVISNITLSHSYMTLFFDCAEDYGKPMLSCSAQFYYKNKELLDKAKKFISECDIGIRDIQIKKEQSIDGEEVFSPIFYHQRGEEIYPLPYSSESRGTQFLFINLLHFLHVSQRPHSLLIFDELDMSLHPFLTKKIISLFIEPNEKDASSCGQMVFTAHDTTIIDTLKADKSFLLNKEGNESFGYRIDECSSAIIRKDRSIRTPYEQGRIGGVPNI